MNHDWSSWIDRLKSPDLTAEELRAFEAALQEDPTNADAYMEALLMETSLESEHLPAPMMQATVTTLPTRRFSLARTAAWAASVAIIAGGAYFAGRGTMTQLPAAAEFVATITDADAAAEKTGIRIGQPLAKGELAVPDHSKIGIAMRGGARLEVHGPAQLVIEDAENVRMLKGRLSTYAPEYAHGFTVNTDDGKVVDLGTRFVTAAGAGHGTEIHVLEGLVEAYTSDTATPKNLPGKQAAILKDGKLESTEYLQQRIDVPLDPVLPDRDGDGISDAVEKHYGTDIANASSKPALLRLDESFASYTAGNVQDSAWQGNGTFLAQGISYRNNGKSLKTSGGALQTIGQANNGAILSPTAAKDLPPEGVIYLSFLSRLPSIKDQPPNPFGGLLLYQGDREELFVGKLSPVASFGSRMKTADAQDSFNVMSDDAPHLFVVRIDRTRLVTDVFMDPALGKAEASLSPQMRYYEAPEFNRIMLRSGSSTANIPVAFDEIRVGLTWDAVLPLAP